MADSTNAAPQLNRVESYQWPSGHVSHLREGQTTALDKFKAICQEQGYYDPGNARTAPTHDDETLLRYLRARKFIPSEAFKQLKDTEDWRKENQLEKLYETIDIKEYESSRRLYPQWTGRRDKRGIPFYVYEIGDLNPKDITAYTASKDKKNQSTNTKVPWKMLKLFALYESLCRFVLPLCSALPDRQHPETPISQSNNIVDMTGVSLSKLFNLRNHMSDASQLATAHYPETLDRIFVVGAPSYFPTVWGWIQRWFDPITVSKIFILSKSDVTSTLAKYCDEESIPKKYGGKLDWKFGDMPNLDPSIANGMNWEETIEQNGHKTFPIGPIKLGYDANGDLEVTAIGTEDGKPRRRVIAHLPSQAGVAKQALSAGRLAEPSPARTAATGIPATPAQATPDVGTAPATNASSTAAEAVLANGVQKREMVADESSATLPTSDSNTGTYLTYNTKPHTHTENTVAPQDSAVPSQNTTPPTQETTNTAPTQTTEAMPHQDARQGTSSTRYEQQESTHASGQLAEGTPEVRVDGQGERQGVMDPNTVGQAPKEHPLPRDEEPPAPGYVAQAQSMAGQAVEQAKAVPAVVMSAVGMGGPKEEAPKEGVGKREDPAVDQMEGRNVEEFLREKSRSKPEAARS